MTAIRLKLMRLGLGISLSWLSVTTSAFAVQETLRFQLRPSGFAERVGMYTPVAVTLSQQKPASVRKLPPEFKPTHFGSLPFVGANGLGLACALEERAEGTGQLLVDANANGDLTDDAPAEWKPKLGKSSADNRAVQHYSGHVDVVLSVSAAAPRVRLGLYRFDPADPAHQAEQSRLYVYSDYGYEGTISAGNSPLRAALLDEGASGSFQLPRNQSAPAVFLLLDIDGDAAFRRDSERFDAARPIMFGGGEFQIAKIAAGGEEIAWTAKNPPAPSQPKLGLAKPFEATTVAGQKVKFPGDYKGKLVLLDFWATWCRPCMVEMPNVVAAADKFRDRGLEVLGISLDGAHQIEALKKTVEAQKMNWPQIHDGKGWKSEFVGLYGVRGIPRAFLVDGTTGEILATGGDLRGPNLHSTIENALRQKSGTAAAPPNGGR